MVTYLADGTVTGHDTLKETGGVSTKKKKKISKSERSRWMRFTFND